MPKSNRARPPAASEVRGKSGSVCETTSAALPKSSASPKSSTDTRRASEAEQLYRQVRQGLRKSSKEAIVGNISSTKSSSDDEEWGSDEEWEWEEEEGEEDSGEKSNLPNGQIAVNVEGRKVLIGPGSSGVPPPPPPPPAPPRTTSAPPPPPPPPSATAASRDRQRKVAERLKKRAGSKPAWNDLMQEIEQFKDDHSLLKKVQCDDRSQPILSATKMAGKFIYDSERSLSNLDILHDIRKGVKLKHVRTNDRSKPNLRGIRTFRRQTTREDRMKTGYDFEAGEDPMASMDMETEEEKDVEDLRDDLESTKQLLELEIRSKKLLERDNRKLQAEVEKLRAEFQKLAGDAANADAAAAGNPANPEAAEMRRDALAHKRNSMIRLISESESASNVHALLASQATLDKGKTIEEEDDDQEEDESRPVLKPTTSMVDTIVDDNVLAAREESKAAIEAIESMREEAEEARRLAEDWEARYKEMQRHMTELDVTKKAASETIVNNAEIGADEGFGSSNDEETWMLKRERQNLETRLRNVRDKRDIVMRERRLLNERIESVVDSIGQELDSRRKLRKEIRDMNEAFKKEILEMEADERTAQDLEECYFSDDEDNAEAKEEEEEDEEEEEEEEMEEDVDESLEDILKWVEEDEEEDPGHALFECYPDSPETKNLTNDPEQEIQHLKGRLEVHNERLQVMRKSNFLLKAKIDKLFDILQMQREKHCDLKQELTRMLADIQ